ncbi:MAG: hypothetical protein JRI31_01635 [Deltaproteobacteria bacterium]|nr:hypothetical protein [Deltaproteobacteria bacterium]HDN59610.1 hypothetical protein [Candidatus Neomarinimicrobiota bacterium]
MKKIIASLILNVFVIMLAIASSGGVEVKFKGWERNSQYNGYYNPKKYTKIKGFFEGFETVVPLPGMDPGLAMLVRLKKSGRTVLVHLGPESFTKILKLAFKRGDVVKVKGVWAEINGQEVFMAAKVRNGEYFEFKLRRTKDGVPYWTLSKEEMIKEKLEE